MEHSPNKVWRERVQKVDMSTVPLSTSTEDGDHYWYTDGVKKQNDRLSRMRERNPGLLRGVLLKRNSDVRCVREESLLHLIDIYNRDGDDDVVEVLFKALCKKCEPKIKHLVNGIPHSKRQDIVDEVISELGLAVIFTNKKHYQFARFQFDLFLRSQVIDAIRRSVRVSQKTISFADIEALIEDVEYEAKLEPIFPDDRDISIEERIVSKEELAEILKRTKLQKHKIEAFLLKELEGLEDEDIAPIFKRTPDTIRKWRNEVKRHIRRLKKG
ncbi:MAG: hypothetical protein ACRD5H_15185 [Nitrososphaerales archaeon]